MTHFIYYRTICYIYILKDLQETGRPENWFRVYLKVLEVKGRILK